MLVSCGRDRVIICQCVRYLILLPTAVSLYLRTSLPGTANVLKAGDRTKPGSNDSNFVLSHESQGASPGMKFCVSVPAVSCVRLS